MNPILQTLADLHEVDHKIVETRRQLDRYPKMIAAMDAAENVQQRRFEEMSARLDAARADGRHLEKDVLALRARISKYKSQQGAVKTNKEYQAMTLEIERIEAEIDAKENEGLDRLAVEEECQRQREEAEKALKALREEHRPERDRIAGQIAEKEERLERLRAERARRLEKVDEEWRETYELLHERFPGTALSTVEEGHCGACQWGLVASTVQRVHAGQDIIRCDHCRRILYDRSLR